MADAKTILNQIVGALDGLAGEPLRLVSDDRPFNEVWGWNMPAMNRHEFAAMIRAPIKAIQDVISDDFEPIDITLLERMPAEIAFLQNSVMPNLPGGNAFHVYITVDSFIRKLDELLDKYRTPNVDWKEIQDKKLVPASIIKELRELDNQIASMKLKKKDLDGHINRILEAAAASRTLKSDIEGLRIARDAFASSQQTISEHQAFIDNARRTVDATLGNIREFRDDAEKLVQDTQGAFAAATTIGLGKEFDTKAKNLAYEVQILSAGLIVVLTIGAVITYYRVDFLHELMKSPPVNIELIWANIVTMFASLAGPVWLAWLMTKQIGQRFRLSEDYAFKASVAKAYAGYRLEASRLDDPEFDRRLFSTALNRIDEAPLRFVEHETDGTPWHGLFRRRSWRLGPVETSDLAPKDAT
jgi:hypothetical protein